MGFWEKAKGTVVTEKKEEVVDLQAKLSKLELSDINYIHDLMIERTYRGRELEQATTTYLKVKFIKTLLEGGIDVEEETKDS